MDSKASQHMTAVVQRSTERVPSLQARKHQFVREAIWDAATNLFADQGFEETTVDDIAAAAGVSRRSFFRYFASKSELMGHGMVSYGSAITAAIEACPETYSLPEVLRETVMRVVEKSTAHSRTEKIMAILAKYPEARAAELSRLAEVQEMVAAAYRRRCSTMGEDGLTASILAGLTLQLAGVTIRWWFEQGQPDVVACVDRAWATLGRVISEERRLGTQPGL